MLSILEPLGRGLLALVFPELCCACGRRIVEGAAFCCLCAVSLIAIGPACPRCALPTPNGRVCLSCLLVVPPLDGARASFEFGGALAEAVRRFKWGQLPELARPLGRLLPRVPVEADALVPVPLHPHRLMQRGYNQAALLCQAVRRGGSPLPIWYQALTRVRDTAPQSRLHYGQRRRNVKGAFEARGVSGARVVLVDDVMTTGATAEACAQTLRKAGAIRVELLTLGRAVT